MQGVGYIMSKIAVVLICAAVVLLAVFSTQSIWLFINYFGFEKPFTELMIISGVIDKKDKAQLLTSKLFGIIMTFLFLTSPCCFLAHLIRPTGYYAYAGAVVLSFLIFRPTRDRYTFSDHNIEKYVSCHSICMDMEKFEQVMRNYTITR